MAIGGVAPNAEHIARFLRALHGEKPSGLWSYTWHLPNKDSAWYSDTEQMIKETQRRAESDKYTAIYTGTTWGIKSYGAKQRVKAKEVAGLRGLWLDLDIAGPGHKKPNLPPSNAAALEFLDEHAPDPSLLVFSGHGLQAWWLFRESWIFASDEERSEAEKLAKDWNDYIRAAAKACNWDIDAVHDLARVMRVPGTVNAKEDQAPVLAELRDETASRYEPAAMRERIESYYASEANAAVRAAASITVRKVASASGAGAAPGAVEGVAVREDAGPPFRKWQVLQDVEPKARQSWEHKRRDLQDQSASSFDLSLATFAARAGWSDQEICDLLVAHRIKYDEDLKRPDYYERTIARARLGVNDDAAKEGISQIVLDAARGVVTPDTPGVRQKALEQLSVRFKVKIVRIIKFCEDPARYVLETERGFADIGGISELLAQAKMRGVIASKLNHLIPPFKKGGEWDEICNVILLALEEWEGDRESTVEGRAWAWLDSYLARRAPMQDASEAAKECAPYERDGVVYIYGAELRKHLGATGEEKVTAKKLGEALRLIGCVPEQINVRVGGRQMCRQVWRLPSAGEREETIE